MMEKKGKRFGNDVVRVERQKMEGNSKKGVN